MKLVRVRLQDFCLLLIKKLQKNNPAQKNGTINLLLTDGKSLNREL